MNPHNELPVVILAAGRGNRLGKITENMPKSMLNVGQQTIAERQVEAVKELGFKEIIVVTGYKTELLEEHLKGEGLEFIFNDEWAVTNNIFSLYLTKGRVKNGFYLFNGDVIFDFAIFKDLVYCTGTAMIIDNVKELGEEEMKVTIENDKIVDISKTIPLDLAHGEYIGLLRFEKEEAALLFDELSKFIEKGERGVWYENAVKNILDDLKIRSVYTKGRKWIEVDDENDYNNMTAMFG
jgi:choline kinase